MPTGHHFTHCRFCGREYVCGDCITDNCELGTNKKSCEHYKKYILQETAAAQVLAKNFHASDKKFAAASRMLADLCWDNVVKEMNNAELADAVLKELWAFQETGSKPAALLAQVIERLRKS